jgi:CheY-like chemotaxis protein
VTHKLLLADDSVTIQRVVELTFSGEDVQVVAVSDGEQAITRIPVERPDIVLADIGMPKRSGYEVAAFVKGQPDLAHIPVLLLAGAFEPVDEARAQQARCDGVLVKPFEPQQVIARVRQLVEGSKGAAARASAAAAPVPANMAPPAAPAVEPAAEPQPAPQTAVPESRVETPTPEVPEVEPRGPIDSRAPLPASRMADMEVPPVDPALDDYFDRLDAAFARLGNASDLPDGPQATHALDDLTAGLDLPTVEDLLGPAADDPTAQPARHYTDASERHPARSAPASQHGEGQTGRNLIADAFSALFAVEQGESLAPVSVASPAAAPPVVTDELVAEVTRRVLERLAPDTVRDAVADVVRDAVADAVRNAVAPIVSETAERLIREEIARIKAAASN